MIKRFTKKEIEEKICELTYAAETFLIWSENLLKTRNKFNDGD